MRLSERRKEGNFYFAVQQTAGEVPGGELEIAVYAASDGDGILTLARTLYFDEQSHEHIDNFCKEFAYDDHYRTICLAGVAHWCRVARLYEANARIMAEEQTLASEALDKSCQEVFHFIRRDLSRIESKPQFQQEMARVSRGEEDDLGQAITLLTRLKDLEISSACQGSALLQVENRNIYLPSCHTAKATISLKKFPHRLRNYLDSGPLRQQHLALIEEDRISARAACHNKRFIRILTASLLAFTQKYGRKG